MTKRGKWQGMLTIARLNWPFYLAAAAVLIGAVCGLIWIKSLELKWLCGVALAGSFYFLVGSLGVSHQVYDRSDLYRWNWLARALKNSEAGSAVFCHSGFDETSAALHEKLGDVKWVVLDHFDETAMTEPSIRRARLLFPPLPGTLPAPFDRWPVASDSADLIFGLLAIHELRGEDERAAWFTEASRCLRENGRVILAEHTRDPANFLAFGPGFLHFHSLASWRRSWERAGFHAIDEFHVTAWVRIFVISAHA